MTRPDNSSGASLDNHGRRAEDRRMYDRLATIETNVATLQTNVATLQADVALIRSNYATKDDVAKVAMRMLAAINDQTWKIIVWVSSVGFALTAGVYFIARNVH
jgi:outer membrane murein-binding lipoprotein Lpp